MPGNLYRRGTTWWARVTVRGAEIRGSLRTTDKAEAKRRLQPWLDRVSGQVYGFDRHTWIEAAAKWAEGIGQSSVGASTLKRYIVSFNMVEPILGSLKLDEINRKVLSQIAGRKGATNATRRRDLTAVSSVLRAAVSWGWIEANAVQTFDRFLYRERRDPIVLPVDADIRALVNACPPMLAALVKVLRLTGLRLEEAGALEWRDVDIPGARITVRRSKTSRSRVVPISAPLMAQIQAHPRHLKSPLVFCNGDGSRMRDLSNRLRKIGLRLDPPFPNRIHDLRHLYAVERLREGTPIHTISAELGHSSVTTTERFYLAYLSVEEANVTRMARA